MPDTSTSEEGMRAGIEAANERNVVGHGILGFVGGVPIGFFAGLGQGDTQAILGGVLGVAVIETSWRIGRAIPPPTPVIEERGAAYARAYSRSYRERLVERRKKAARVGGLVGTLSGVGLLFFALSQMTT